MKKLTLLFFALMMSAFSWQGNAQYCAVGADDSSYKYITNVTLAGINNTTGGHSGYNDFTAQKANVTQGETYQISVSIVADGNDYLDVFIDWNHTGWTSGGTIPASQVYPLVGPTSEDGTYTMDVTVPVDAVLGDTRMRVKLRWDDNANPCETSFEYGEVEDYTVNVSAASICEDPTNLVASNITDTTADLSWIAGDGQTDWIVIYGEADFDPLLDEGTEVPVDTDPETTIENLSQDTEYDFYVKAICGSDESDLVGPMGFTTETTEPTSPPVVELNSAGDFGVLAGSGLTSAGASIISNTNVGVSPSGRGTITGSIVVVNGALYAADDSPAVAAMLLQAKSDLQVAYDFAAGASAPAPATVAGDLGGQTLFPGIYKSTSSLKIQEGDLTLDAQGDPNAKWIFQISSTLTTVSGGFGNVILTGGAQAKNITWQVGSSATIATTFKGNILAHTSITMGVGSTIDGRLLAINGLVALSGSITIDQPCAAPLNLAVSNVTGDSANISWEEGSNETEWEVSYGPANFDPNGTNGTTVAVSINPETTLNNLDISTDYDVYVRAICDVTNEIEWAGPVSFTTGACGTTTVPYTMDFESVMVPNLPECTSRENNGVGNDWKTNSVLFGIFGNVLNYSAHSTPGPANSWFYTQGIELMAGVEYQISYIYGNAGLLNNESMKVAYGTSPNEEAMTTQLADHPNIFEILGSVGTTTFTIATDGVYYFGFNAYSEANQGELYVDDIEIVEAQITDYVYENEIWTPGDPSGVSTANDNILIKNGSTSLTADTEIGKITIFEDATLSTGHVINLNGNLTLDGRLVFTSDENSTGQLAEMPEGANIIYGPIGKVTVQRYIPAGDEANDGTISKGRAFRFMSSAVNTTGSIHDNWQEGATSYIDNPKLGYGTHITGLNTIEGNTVDEQDESKDQQNGFDYTPSGNPSLYVYDNGSQAWNVIDNTNADTLAAGAPYQLMVRGDRSVDVTNTETAPTNTILEATGRLHIGDFIKTDLGQNDGDFNFFGNPYQAAVDMTKVVTNSTNINANFYIVYDPTLSTRGAFVSVELTENVGDNSLGSDANQFLQAGQAAFVTTDSDGAAQLLFKETDKATGEPQTDVFSVPSNSYINMQLLHNAGVTDGLRIYFDQNGNNEVLSNDAPKYGNLDENLAVVNVANYLSIEHRALPTEEEVLPLFVNQYRHSSYSFKAEVPEQLGEVTAYLDDAYLNTHNVLPSGETTMVSFDVDQEIAESVAADRFSISFEPSALDVNQNDRLSFSVWPNPTPDRFNIQVPTTVKGGMVDVTIYSIIGQQVYHVQKTAETNTISIENANLSSGVYMVKMTVKDTSSTQKLIIQ